MNPKLPEDTILYPGHDYNGKKFSTIGNEKRFNPRLQVRNAEEYTELMSISEMEEYLSKNKHISQVLQPINIVAGVSGLTHKNDQGWKENMSRIAEAHPTSPLAERYGKKSIKQIKTQQALAKNKKRIASRRKK